MLDKKDLSAIKELIDESLDARFAAYDEKMDARFAAYDKKMDEKFASNNEKLEKIMDAKLHESENAILDEMDRIRGILEEKIQKVDDKVDRLESYVRVAKIDGENARLALEAIMDHEKRIQKLESQIA